MLKNILLARSALVLFLMVSACGGDDKDILEPGLGGKYDIVSRVQEKGRLDIGAAVEGEFTLDLEFHAYRFLVSADAALTLDVTQKGSSRGLDTTLFVYGPRRSSGGFGDAYLARDDDDGWGALSRLKGLALAEAGEYLAVVGTADGAGRGRYRLELLCLNDLCAEVEITECPAQVEQSLRDCVDEVEGESEYETVGQEALEICLTDHAGDIYHYYCEMSWQPPAAWCLASLTEFADRIVPMCRDKLMDEYEPGPEPTLELSGRSLPYEIEEMIDVVAGDCYACSVWAAAYTYDMGEHGLAALDEVLLAVQYLQEAPPQWHNGGERDASMMHNDLDNHDLGDLVEAVADFVGTSTFKVGELSRSYYLAAGAEAWESVWVMHFENGWIVAVSITDYET